MKARVFRPGQSTLVVEAATVTYEDTGVEPDPQWLRDTIGCRYFELVRMPVGDLWVDEEGKLDECCEYNQAATEAFEDHLMPGDFIAGTAVFFPRT